MDGRFAEIHDLQVSLKYPILQNSLLKNVFCLIGFTWAVWLSGCQVAPKNAETEISEESGWTSLFHGNDLSGIRIFTGDPKQLKRWSMEEGVLALAARDRANGDKSKVDIIVTDRVYADFELHFEWKVSAGGNGGIFYRVAESGYELPWHTGLEYQLLDNKGHKEGKIETHRAGDLFDLIASKKDASRPALEWNTSRIVAQGKRFEHWLNGYKVLEIEIGSEAWETAYAKSKYVDYPSVGALPEGHIVIQDHGDAIWFRNLKIREL